MKWLRKLIEGARVNEEGHIDLEDLMKKIQEEFPKNAVPKSEFNEARKKLKIATATIAVLKENGHENEMLLEIIKQQDLANQKLRSDIVNTIKSYSLKKQYNKSGMLDLDYLICKKRGLAEVYFDKEGTPMDIVDLIKSL